MVTIMSLKEVFKDKSQILEAEKRRNQLFKEINSGMKEPLDRNIFKKTAEERGKLFTLKAEWKKNMQICYPNPKERKYRNNPISL
jgi:hypothetical protein